MSATAVSIQPSAISEHPQPGGVVLPWVFAEEAVDSDSWIVDSEETLTAAFSHQPLRQAQGRLSTAISEHPQPGGVVLPWVFACADLYCPTRKVLGEQAECAFLAEAMARGLIVSKPYGDSAPYDFVVGRRAHRVIGRSGHRVIEKNKAKGRRQEAGGRLWKVQVKSARVLGKGQTYQISSRHGGGRYRPGEVDFFAAWVAPLDVWYIVPAQEIIARTKAGFYPQVAGSRGKYEKYREAWEMLKS
jgi:hypothetical protein